jgi:hypothetical protein
MANKKKLTMKEVEERINILAYNLNAIKPIVDNIGLSFSKYLNFKGDLEDFKKYLENMDNVDKLKESVKKDAK